MLLLQNIYNIVMLSVSMAGVWFYTLTSVIIVSLLSLIGVLTLAVNKKRLTKMLLFMVSFAVGALFGDAFIHIIPEAFKKMNELAVSLLIIVGILIFFSLEKFIRWRHCHIPTTKKHQHPVATMNLIGDGLHNLIDGMLIGASYLVSMPIGIATTIAIILHEIPQEIGDFSILIYSGMKTGKALLFNFLSALVAVIGAIISLIVGTNMQNYSAFLLPITAGGFLYIAGSDLIPELHHDSEKMSDAVWQFVSIILGVAIMAALLLVG